MNKITIPKKQHCFRQWSRKKYSVLISLGKVIKIGVLCLAYSLVNRLPVINAQQDTADTEQSSYELEAVEVIGRRSAVVTTELSRVLGIIQRDEIEQSGVQSIIDLLEFVSNADIRQRGVLGVQADVSIRGSSFDHVMILLNGVPLGDPQTGHFSLDLPIDPEIIERIEILEGPAARTLGPGAFMGAVNIVTRQGDNEMVFSQSFGMHQLLRSHFHAGFKTGAFSNFISAGTASSSGYRENTDFSLYNAYYRAVFQNSTSRIDFQGGYQFKEFGAAGFYSPRFPEQFEETGTGFGSIGASTGTKLKLQSRVYWRRKKDHFLLVRDNPAFYENFHLTDVYGSQFNITYHQDFFTSTIGFDHRSEHIFSNNIGLINPDPRPVKGSDSAFYTRQFQRNNFASFIELMVNFKRLSLTGGFMLNWNTSFDEAPFFFPGLDVSYKIANRLSIFASINRALHLPTFTDLFYTDPVNEGNMDLIPNRMTTYEGGLKYSRNGLKTSISGFHNSGKDIIDWVWNYSANRFSPVNMEQYKSTGISAQASLDMPGDKRLNKLLSNFSINYMWLQISKSAPDSVSKYYNLRNKLSLSLAQNLFDHFGLFWNISYQDRFGEAIQYNHAAGAYAFEAFKPYWLINGTAKWNIKALQLFAEVSNILNTRYIDAGSVEQPGRWFRAGVVIGFIK
jgi:iron complex outermembrane receptor protein